MIIKVPSETKLAVVGDIHEHDVQFYQLLEKLRPNPKLWLISVGDIWHKGFGLDKAEQITDTFKQLSQDGIGYLVKGNHEIYAIREARKINAMTPQLLWMENQPLSLAFEFTNGTKLTVLHGGILPGHTNQDIQNNIEICYVRYIDNTEVWHNRYDGRFGYIASGHNAQKDGIAKFYNFSCNLDSCVYRTGILTCQIFGSDGLEELIQISGPTA